MMMVEKNFFTIIFKYSFNSSEHEYTFRFS